MDRQAGGSATQFFSVSCRQREQTKMATRFKRFRAYFPGKICPLGACGHSHFVCLALKLVTLLLLSCGGLALSAASARADSFVEFDYNIFSTRARGTVFLEL